MRRITLGRDTSGRPLVIDDRTQAKLTAAESALGFKFTIVQGSYRGGNGAAASAGTHDGGGVIDLRVWNLPPSITPREAVRALRRAGFIAWYRDQTHGFDPHIHAIDYGNPALSPAAANQVRAYEAGCNGLASNGPDDGPRVDIPKNPPEDDMAFDLMDLMRHDLTKKGDITVASALRDAHQAAARAKRIENAVKALGKALGPTVEKAVNEALADATVDVDVTVKHAKEK